MAETAGFVAPLCHMSEPCLWLYNNGDIGLVSVPEGYLVDLTRIDTEAL